MNRVALFVNDNEVSKRASEEIREKLLNSGFIIDQDDYEIAIAVGGDGAFLRMVKNTNFKSDVAYVGVNVGTLGFLQEVTMEKVDEFIEELKNGDFKLDVIGIQETTVDHEGGSSKFCSLNEIEVRDKDLKVAKFDIYIEDDLLENFYGDGVIIASSIGSAAHSLNCGGSLVYDTFDTLQITPMAPINTRVYRSLSNSVIIPSKKEITLLPNTERRDFTLTVDGENSTYKNVLAIKTSIDERSIKFIRLKHYNFPEKINEKLLTDRF